METLESPIPVPFNRPCVMGREVELMLDALKRDHISGDGHYTQLCHNLLARELGAPKVLLTTSCTHALEMSALLLDIRPGDEVILPSFTFVSTANAFLLRGARPVFADIRPDTLNLDESKVEGLISSHTKAIVPVHYAGVACAMDVIMDISQRHKVAVVEDNAHGLFGTYKGKYLGTFGCLAAQSFHDTKNFTCGEGGALLVNDSAFVDRAEIIREKGTNRSKFYRGQIDKYSWVDLGSSYLPSDLLAAFLFAQLEARDRIQAARKRMWECYHQKLKAWADANDVRLPIVPADCGQAYHMYYILLPSLERRQALIAHLKARGIQSVFHYLPLHLSTMGRTFGGKEGDCPVTEDLSNRILRLPFYNTMTESEQSRVISGLESFDA